MKRLVIAALAVATVCVVAGSALAAGNKSSVIFDSTNPNGPQTNMVSYGPDGVLLRDDRRQDHLQGGNCPQPHQRDRHAEQLGLPDGQLERQGLRHAAGSDVLAADHADDLRTTVTRAPARHVDEDVRRSLPAVGQPQVHRRGRREVV